MKFEIILAFMWAINLIVYLFVLKKTLKKSNSHYYLFVYFLSLGGIIFNILNI